MEGRDFWRWIKQGYLLIIAVVILNIIAGYFKLSTWNIIITTLSQNPTSFVTTIFGLTILSVLFMLVVYPIALGFILEEIQKRVRK